MENISVFVLDSIYMLATMIGICVLIAGAEKQEGGVASRGMVFGMGGVAMINGGLFAWHHFNLV